MTKINDWPILIACALILLVYLIHVFHYMLIVLMILDLMLLLIILVLAKGLFLVDIYGYILILLCVAAADTAVGLSLFISYFKLTGKTYLT